MVGVITFDESGDFHIYELEPKTENPNGYWNPHVEETRLQAVTDIKLELLKNMGLPEILKICNLSTRSTWTDFIAAITRLSFNQILETIENASNFPA